MWRIATIEPPAHELHGKQFPLDIDEEKVDLVSNTIEKTILKRGSTRQFARVSITFRQLSNLLYRSTRGIPADFLYTPGTSLMRSIFRRVSTIMSSDPRSPKLGCRLHTSSIASPKLVFLPGASALWTLAK